MVVAVGIENKNPNIQNKNEKSEAEKTREVMVERNPIKHPKW